MSDYCSSLDFRSWPKPITWYDLARALSPGLSGDGMPMGLLSDDCVLEKDKENLPSHMGSVRR